MFYQISTYEGYLFKKEVKSYPSSAQIGRSYSSESKPYSSLKRLTRHRTWCSDDPLVCDITPQCSFYSLTWFWGWLGSARCLFLSFFHGGGDWKHWQAFPVTSLTTNPGCKWSVSWNLHVVPSPALHISHFWEQASQGAVREGTSFIRSGPRSQHSITSPTLPVSHQPSSKRMRPIGPSSWWGACQCIW